MTHLQIHTSHLRTNTITNYKLQIQLVKGGKKEDTPANTHKPLTYKCDNKLQITNTISKRWKERGYTYKYTLPTFSHTNIITNYKLQIQLIKGGKKEDTPANTHMPLTCKCNNKLQITNTISKRWKERGYTYKYTLPIFSCPGQLNR